MDELTTEAKCRAIFEKILFLANAGEAVTFDEDGGDNTLTIWRNDEHTHVGVPEGSFEISPEYCQIAEKRLAQKVLWEIQDVV